MNDRRRESGDGKGDEGDQRKTTTRENTRKLEVDKRRDNPQ